MAHGHVIDGSDLWENGPTVGGFYQMAPRAAAEAKRPVQHTLCVAWLCRRPTGLRWCEG